MSLQDRLSPFVWNVPIVNSDGTPTNEFLRQWQATRTIVGNIPDFSVLPKHTVVLGKGGYQPGFVPVGTNGQLLIGQTGADPGFKTVSGDLTMLASGAGTVTGIQGHPVSNAAPVDGEIFRWSAADAKWDLKAEFASTVIIGSDVYTAMAVSLADPEMVLAGGVPVYVKNALAIANFSDFATGAWTPTIKLGGGNTGITYNSPLTHGRYTKIGNMVLIQFLIVLTSKGSSTGLLTVEGLPFPTLNDTNMRTAGTILANSGVNNTAGGTIWSANGQVNASNLQISYQTAGAITAVFDTDLSNTTELIGSFTYMTGP